MTNDKLFNILEYLIDNLEYYYTENSHLYCTNPLHRIKHIRREVFSNQPDGLTFDVIPKIPTED
jgi:hypothetical protein